MWQTSTPLKKKPRLEIGGPTEQDSSEHSSEEKASIGGSTEHWKSSSIEGPCCTSSGKEHSNTDSIECGDTRSTKDRSINNSIDTFCQISGTKEQSCRSPRHNSQHVSHHLFRIMHFWGEVEFYMRCYPKQKIEQQ